MTAEPSSTENRDGIVDRGRRLEPDARRAQILRCAVRLYGQRPYEQVSASDVAAAAGVTRGLVNHYFGTKKDLYLAVVKALLTIPPDAFVKYLTPLVPSADRALSRANDIAVRADEVTRWYLDSLTRHAEPWLAAIGATAPSLDPDVAAVIAEADESTVDVLLKHTVGSTGDPITRAAAHGYVAFARRASVEWLVSHTLTRAQVHVLLTRTLIDLLQNTVPALREPTGSEPPAAGTLNE